MFSRTWSEKSTSAQSQTICLPPPSLSASRRHPHFSLLAFHLHADVLVRSTRLWIFSNFGFKASRRKKTFFSLRVSPCFFLCGAEGVDGWMVGWLDSRPANHHERSVFSFLATFPVIAALTPRRSRLHRDPC